MTNSLLENITNISLLNESLRKLSGENRIMADSVKIVRHKEGRRTVFEIEARVINGTKEEKLTVFGKFREKGVDQKTYELNKYLYNNGFDEESEDQISVPKPVAMVPELNLCLYLKVRGDSTIRSLSINKEWCARQVIRVLKKLNSTEYSVSRNHTLDDELAILDQRLSKMIDGCPQWSDRLSNLKNDYHEVAKRMAPVEPKLIHRDFYHDQMLFDKKRAYLLDLDVCSMGDPALDVGNFLAHVQELSIRQPSMISEYQNMERTILDEFIHSNICGSLENVRGYICLSLIRHISISHEFPERRSYTEQILTRSEKLVHQFLNSLKVVH